MLKRDSVSILDWKSDRKVARPSNPNLFWSSIGSQRQVASWMKTLELPLHCYFHCCLANMKHWSFLTLTILPTTTWVEALLSLVSATLLAKPTRPLFLHFRWSASTIPSLTSQIYTRAQIDRTFLLVVFESDFLSV